MSNKEYSPAGVQKHIDLKAEYDAAFQKDAEQNKEVKAAEQAVKDLYRESKNPYFSDEQSQASMSFRVGRAALDHRMALESKVDTEDGVAFTEGQAAKEFADHKEEIHAWALDEAKEAGVMVTGIPVEAVEDPGVHVPVTVK